MEDQHNESNGYGSILHVRFMVNQTLSRTARMFTGRLTKLRPGEIVSVIDRTVDPGSGKLRAVRRIRYRLLRREGELTLHCEVVDVENLAGFGSTKGLYYDAANIDDASQSRIRKVHSQSRSALQAQVCRCGRFLAFLRKVFG
jgi:hypothetical protein